jgi:hypothetical protein
MRRIPIMVVLLLFAHWAQAGMNEVLRAIAESEFEFQKTESDLPYPPFAWVRAVRYQASRFDSDMPGSTFDQSAFSHALFSPVYASERDILLAGYYYGFSAFDFRQRGMDDGRVHLIGAGAGWLRQIKPDWMTALFVAPLVHSNIRGGSPWETEWYVGGLARYYYEPDLQFFAGGVYIYSFGEHIIYPYLGTIWLPHPRLSIAAMLPWPSAAYAIDTKTVLRIGAAPSGAQWRTKNDAQVSHDYGGWDLGLSVERKIMSHVWLGASAGWSGLRAFSINMAGEIDYRTQLDGKPYVSVQFSLRP